MANVVVAKNQTGSPISTPQLPIPAGELPASPSQVVLTDFATLNEIQIDPTLPGVVNSGDVVLNLNGTDLSTAEGVLWLAAGSGDVVGPDSSVDGNIASFNGALGKFVQDSGVAISDLVTTNGSETLSGKKVPVATYSTSPQTLTISQKVVLVNAGSNPITINLPTAVGSSGLIYHIKKVDGTSNAVTIDPSGAETIDNSATIELTTTLQSVTLVSDGSNWWII